MLHLLVGTLLLALTASLHATEPEVSVCKVFLRYEGSGELGKITYLSAKDRIERVPSYQLTDQSDSHFTLHFEAATVESAEGDGKLAAFSLTLTKLEDGEERYIASAPGTIRAGRIIHAADVILSIIDNDLLGEGRRELLCKPKP